MSSPVLREPVEILRQGLKQWFESSADLSSMRGFSVGRIGTSTQPKSGDRSTHLNVRFGKATLTATSTSSRYHRVFVIFRVHGTSQSEAASHGAPLYERLEGMEAKSDKLFPPPAGRLVGVRVTATRSVQLSNNMHAAEYTAAFNLQTNRG